MYPVHEIVVVPRAFEISRYGESVVDPMGGSQSVAVSLVALNLYGRKGRNKNIKGKLVFPEINEIYQRNQLALMESFQGGLERDGL